MAGAMIGRSVRTLIPERKLAGGIRGSTITPGRLVPISEKAVAKKETLASSLTEFSSVGFIHFVTGLSHVKTAVTVAGKFVSLLTHRISLGIYRIGAQIVSIPLTFRLRFVIPVRERFSSRYLLFQARRR